MQAENGHTQSVADAMIAQLAAAGVQRIYGVIGDSLFPFADALARQSAVTFIAAVHEASAAFMASYEAKLTGRLAACMATSGPGTTNLATGIAEAFFDHAPVIAITGQVESNKVGTEAKQFFDQQALMHPISSRTELVLSADAALNALSAAIAHAMLQRRAVHLSVPKDVFVQQVDWAPLPVSALDGMTPCRDEVAAKFHSHPPLLLGERARALEALHTARRPLIVLGLVPRRIAEQAARLADTLGAAIVVAQQAKGLVPFANEHVIGGIGEAHVPSIIADADCVVLIGSAPFELPFVPPGTPAIVIGTRPTPLPGRMVLAECIGDPSHLLTMLATSCASRTPDPMWLDAIRQVRQALNQQVEQLYATSTEGPVNPYRLAFRLSQALAEDAIVTLDTGAFTHWFDLGFRASQQDVLISSHWRGMGAGLPAAIAAKLAAPSRQVVGLIGDGGMLMSMAELMTAVRYELPILLVIVRNASYDIERQKMRAQGFAPLGTRLLVPDFAAYTAACGAVGFTVNDTRQLDSVLHDALTVLASANGPVLLDIHTSAPDLPHISP